MNYKINLNYYKSILIFKLDIKKMTKN